MALKGIINVGSRVEIIFQADYTNIGSTAMLSGFVPDNGYPQMEVIAPGGISNIVHTDVPNVKQLKIYIDTPEPTGSGRLIVVENGVVKNDEPILDDSVWTYIVK